MNETAMLLELINSTGGIPLVVNTTTTTNWTQLALTLIMGSIGLVYLFVKFGKESFNGWLAKFKLNKIKRKAKCDIFILKHTESGLFGGSMIERNLAIELKNKIEDSKKNKILLILHTPGGEVFGANLVSKVLRNSDKEIKAVVPYYAMSGGTLLSLSCKEIYMSEIASLGPVDVQIGSLFKSGAVSDWNKLVKTKGKKADDGSILMNSMGTKYNKMVREGFKELIKDKVNKESLNKVTDIFTKGELPHGYCFGVEDLKQMGFNIKGINNKDMKLISEAVEKASEGLS